MMVARHERKKSKKNLLTNSFSDDKIEAMKQKAREISKMIGQHSKTVMNQQKTPTEICTDSEHCSEVDLKLCHNDTETSQNNHKLSTFVNKESSNIPSCSKSAIKNTSLEIIEIPKYASKRTNKHFNTKHKKHKKPKIPYLVKCDIYQEDNVDDLTSKKQDDYVLEKLFNKSGRFYYV